MRDMLSSVSEKGQVTIPVEIRRRLGVKPRDKVAFRLENGEVKLVRIGSPLDSIFQVVPALKEQMSVEEMVHIAAEEHAQHAAREGL